MIIKKPIWFTFHLLIIVSSKLKKEICDEITVEHEKLCNEVRLTIMFVVLGDYNGMNEDKAPLEAIQRMNAMLKCIINKVPTIQLGPWNNEGTTTTKILSEIPEDVDVVAKFVFGFIDSFLLAIESIAGFIFSSTNLQIWLKSSSIISGFKKA